MNTEIRHSTIGDTFGVKIEKYDVYYLCQIVKKDNDKNKVAILLINYFREFLPKIDEVKKLKPLLRDHHFWKGDLHLFWTDISEIQNLVYIGNTEPIYIDDEIERSGRVMNQYEPILQYLWQELPTEVRDKFKENATSSATTKVYIEEKKESSFWNGLNDLPCLYGIVCSMWNDELLDFLAKKPLITELDLRNTTKNNIDISKTYIQEFTLDVTGVENIKLNKNIHKLYLYGDFTNLKVIEDIFQGKYISLQIANQSIFPNITGIENLQILSIISEKIDVVDISKQFKKLEELKIWGENGLISNIMKLKELKLLETLWLMNIFGFDDFPKLTDLPNLKMLWLTNVPKSAGLKIKKEFKLIDDLEITKLRNEEWIKLNLENPMGSWDGREGTTAATAKKAMKIYNDAYKKLNNESVLKTDAIKTLEDFIENFNTIDKKHSIDTLEREEIWEAFTILSKKTILTAKETEEIFENLRDF